MNLSGALAPRVAGTVLCWQDGHGVVWSTLVAKLTTRLVSRARAVPVDPIPLVAFDRVSSDSRLVDASSEVFPVSRGAAILATTGPLQVTLARASEPPCTYALGGGERPGPSMSAPERKRLAPTVPSRVAGGILRVASDLDPRFFFAAPPQRWRESLHGDESITLVSAMGTVQGSLAGLAIVANVRTTVGVERVVALRFDLLVVDGRDDRVSLVARAPVRGEVAAVHFAAGPLERLTASDRGDEPQGPAVPVAPGGTPQAAIDGARRSPALSLSGTAPISVRALRRKHIPFDSPRHAAGGVFRSPTPPPEVPATPFDPGFQQPAVMPAGRMEQTQAMAPFRDLRSQTAGQPAAAPATLESTSSPAVDIAPPAAPAPAEPPRVAPPKRGAMAKPRPRKR